MRSTSIAVTLKSLKVSQLSHILSSVGGKTSGRKDDLVGRIEAVLGNKTAAKETTAKQRVLSIDMGIRNLALCSADIHFPPSPNSAQKKTEFNVVAWTRIDLTKGQTLDFAPSALSQTAHALVTDTLLPLRPDTILIERQRFRTSRASAVQEWTLRVNTLEAMLWATLTTLRNASATSSTPLLACDVQSASPARVAAFWAAEGKALDKKAKVGLVEAWVRDGGPDAVSLTFEDDVGKVFAKTRGQGKRDDLADSLIQGLTWAVWSRNQRRLAKMSVQELTQFAGGSTA